MVVGAWYLRTLASLSVVALIYLSWQLWGLAKSFSPKGFSLLLESSSSASPSLKVYLGLLTAQLALIAITYFGVNVLLLRVEDILKQPTGTDYTATHVVAVLIKALVRWLQ